MTIWANPEIPGEIFYPMHEEYEQATSKYPKLNGIHVEVCWNKRLKTSAGRCKAECGNIAVIELNHKYYQEFGAERVLQTFRHELAHAILFAKGRSAGHTAQFKRICADLGGSMNKHMARASREGAECATEQYIQTPHKYEYTCPTCGATMRRKKRLSKRLYTHGSCRKCGERARYFKVKELK